jgi:PAS domain S-box-containing protein
LNLSPLAWEFAYQEKLKALHKHASQLGLANSIDEIAKYTLDAMEFALGFDFADIAVVRDERLKVIGYRGPEKPLGDVPLDGRGVTAKAANTKTTIRISDTRKEPEYVDGKGFDWNGPPTMLSELAVPVAVDRTTVAVLNVESRQPNAFMSGDQDLLEILAFHVSSAFKRLKYEEKLMAIHVHASQLSSDDNIDDILKHTLDAMQVALGFDYGDVLLVEKGHLRVRGTRGKEHAISELPLDGPGLVVKAARNMTTIRIPDTGKEDDFVDRKGLDWRQKPTMLSELAVPVIVGEDVAAVLNAERESPDAFTAEDQKLLETLASHVGSAMGRLEKADALRESEVKYRTLVEQSMQGIIVAQGEFPRIVFTNTQMANILGYTTEGLMSLSPREMEGLIHPDDRAMFFGRFSDRLQGKPAPSQYEFRALRRDGKVRWLEISSTKIEYNGQPAVQATFTDITERKRMEDDLKRYSTQLEELVAQRTRELSASKDYSENLIKTANAMVLGLDKHGNIRVFNQAAERITGYTRKELEGRNWFDVIVPKDRYPEVWREFERLAGGLPKNFENPILTKSGEERYIVWQNNEVREQGKMAGMISFGIDITERKRMEEQLRVARERLEYLIGSNPAVIYSGKPFADLSDWELSYLSENAASMLGYEAREFIGHPEFWAQVIHPKDRPSVLADIRRLWEKGRFTFEYRMRRKDGNYRWIREEAKVVRDGYGKPIEVNGYWTDITELKQLEEALLDSQRLATIGKTAAMVGHDLRNPLQATTAMLYLVKKLVRSPKVGDRKDALELLDGFDDQISYMDKIVSDLQNYAAPVEAEQVETNLPDLITDVFSNVGVPENVKTSVEVQEDLSKVMVDSTLLHRVVTNLVTNAVQAMPKGGRLITTAHKEQEALTVTVQDTGEGIPAENLDKIFTPFFTTKAKGQGLGLAVCKRLVEAQNGTISVKSKVGKGSAFTLKIPTNRTSGAA